MNLFDREPMEGMPFEELCALGRAAMDRDHRARGEDLQAKAEIRRVGREIRRRKDEAGRALGVKA